MRLLTLSQWRLERFENGSDMCGFRSLDKSASKKVLNLLEPVKLTVWKVVIERVTVIKFRMDNGGASITELIRRCGWLDCHLCNNVKVGINFVHNLGRIKVII